MGYIWDLLRPLDQMAVSFDAYITPVVLVVSLILLAVAIRAYQKKPSRRFMLLVIAFGFFAAKSVLMLLDIFFSPGRFFSMAAQDFFELIILFSLFLALFQK
jgi:hypothetical protein